MRKKKNKIQKTLARQQRSRLVWQIMLFLILSLLWALAFYWLLRQRTWYADDPLWPFLNYMDSHYELCVILFLLWMIVGTSVIFWLNTRRLIRYIDEITMGVEEIIRDNSQPVTMEDGELLVVEEQLNLIRENYRRSAAEARDAIQRKNDLIMYLAHDLKTPLTSVIGYLTLLQEEEDISLKMRSRYLGIARQKAERLEDLINEFFEITRFNLSEIVLEYSDVNVTTMLEQIAYEFRPLLAEKQLTYRLELEKDVHLVCDVDKMSRVFDNLMRNAISYSYEGGEILISMKCEGESVEIVFSNPGKTIPEEKRKRIFEQFFRMESARGTKTGGAGLGLAIAREIIRSHGGELTCESECEEIHFRLVMDRALESKAR
ncbi:MAG: HAMP domain-containing histidine kinase [Lachnospiraceae bacterium]|nr:HAMP domain-containing histidine kinase [Lachnospiraceae bacterium]